jgi:hypothetical protein
MDSENDFNPACAVKRFEPNKNNSISGMEVIVFQNPIKEFQYQCIST